MFLSNHSSGNNQYSRSSLFGTTARQASDIPLSQYEKERYDAWLRLVHRKYNAAKLVLLRLISPIVVSAIFLLFYFPYQLAEGKIESSELLPKTILFLFMLPNCMLADFAIWNYFEGKKIALIWAIECVIAFAMLYAFV